MVKIGSAIKKVDNRNKKTHPYYGSRLHRSLRTACLERDNYLCQECIKDRKDKAGKTIKGRLVGGNICDHIIPREAGGKDILENTQTMCKRCHAKKSIEDKKYYK